MKKFVTLIFGLLIACVAVFAVPKELEKVPLNDLIKIEINHDAVAPIVTSDIQIDVDDGVAETHMEIKDVSTASETIKYVAIDEGVPLAGHRRWFNPRQQTPIGLFNKNQVSTGKRSPGMHGLMRPGPDFSRRYNLIE